MSNKQKIFMLVLALAGNFTFLATAKDKPYHQNEIPAIHCPDTAGDHNKTTGSDNCRFECKFIGKR